MKVVIIYNPNSTGDGKANATELARELRREKIDVQLRKTTHAGHATEIAEAYAASGEEIVLISSSGDGGYHEVVNGALAAGKSKLVVGVLPSGNANDHHSDLSSGNIAKAIINKKYRRIDTIRLTSTVKGKPWVRYAHSYVGIGVTAVAAKRLTEERPNEFSEKWIVLHSLFSFRSVKLKEAGKTHRYSSVIFSNISKMSKVIKLSQQSSVTDGRFEMTTVAFGSKLRLLAYLLTAATVGLNHGTSRKRYTCTSRRPLNLQVDGESYTLDAGSKLVVEAVKQNLHCVL